LDRPKPFHARDRDGASPALGPVWAVWRGVRLGALLQSAYRDLESDARSPPIRCGGAETCKLTTSGERRMIGAASDTTPACHHDARATRLRSVKTAKAWNWGG
jgi:hypothetical protein